MQTNSMSTSLLSLPVRLFLLRGQSESRCARATASTALNVGVFAWIVKTWIASGLNVTKAKNALIFDVPRPSYTLEESPAPTGAGPNHNQANQTNHASQTSRRKLRLRYRNDIPPSSDTTGFMPAARAGEVHVVTVAPGIDLPLVWFHAKAPPASTEGPRPVLLHFHGNGHDLGSLMATYFELSQRLCADVVGVEYRGFGAAGGRPSVRHLTSDAMAVYEYVRAQGVPAEKIIAYGHCLGSSLACRLAAECNLGGFILHAPLLSALKAVEQPDGCCRPSWCFCCCDDFANRGLLAEAACPGMVVHGCSDEVVPWEHGQLLQEAIPEALRWPGFFPEETTHDTICTQEKPAYFRALNGFLSHIQERAELAAVREPGALAHVPGGPETVAGASRWAERVRF